MIPAINPRFFSLGKPTSVGYICQMHEKYAISKTRLPATGLQLLPAYLLLSLLLVLLLP